MPSIIYSSKALDMRLMASSRVLGMYHQLGNKRVIMGKNGVLIIYERVDPHA